jgi:hypothetical protein
VEFLGNRYCGYCRDFRLAQMQGPAPGAIPPPTAADQIIPTRNPHALIGYYTGVFSLVPCLALVAGPAAVILGVSGLRAQRENPNLSGKAHAIVAIVLGGLTSLVNWGLLLFALLSAAFRR